MKQITEADHIKKDELVYWIDKRFVQEIAVSRIGRNLNDNEVQRFTRMIEWGLWDTVHESVKIAIDETVREDN